MQTTSVDDVLQNSWDIAMTYINRLISKVNRMLNILPIKLNAKDNY